MANKLELYMAILLVTFILAVHGTEMKNIDNASASEFEENASGNGSGSDEEAAESAKKDVEVEGNLGVPTFEHLLPIRLRCYNSVHREMRCQKIEQKMSPSPLGTYVV